MAAAASTPRLLNLNTPITRDQRTLVWLQNQDGGGDTWGKWDGVVSSLRSFKRWSEVGAHIVGIVLNQMECDNINDFTDELFSVAKGIPLILLPQSILSQKKEEFWAENFDNVMNLDGLHEQYPFITKEWDGTRADAVAVFALLCRYNRLVDCDMSDERRKVLENVGIALENGVEPNKAWIVTQYFKHKDRKRYREIRECLVRNCSCPHIDRVVLLNERDYSAEWEGVEGAEKIQQVVMGRRLTYADFLRFCVEKVPTGVYVALCNADIYFGDSLLDLWKINMTDKMLGLLRWDTPGAPTIATIFGPRADSQDSWIFLSDSVKARSWDYSKFEFQLGQAGCDNAFAGLILRQRFLLANPALTFKTYHIHESGVRNYSKADYIKADIYVNMAPTHILDTRQEVKPAGPAVTTFSNETTEFEVKSSSMSNEITYCTMLEKEGRYKWEPSVENYYFEAALSVYSWKNSGVTPNGLVYDLHRIYRGAYADTEGDRFNYWTGANVDIFTPLSKVKQMLAIPFKDTAIFKSYDRYVLNYVSRVLRLLKLYPDAALWLPGDFMRYIAYLNWPVTTVNGVVFDESMACWADEVVGYLPGPAVAEISKEDIACLREALPDWISAPVPKVCAVVLSGAITEEYAKEKIAKLLKEQSDEWTVLYMRPEDVGVCDDLLGASLCVFIGGKKTEETWSKLWALPDGCRVIEFQQELQIDGEFQHLAHVAGFKPWVLLLSKGSVADVQEQIVEQLTRWFKKNGDEV
jgi:hypothetical protein